MHGWDLDWTLAQSEEALTRKSTRVRPNPATNKTLGAAAIERYVGRSSGQGRRHGVPFMPWQRPCVIQIRSAQTSRHLRIPLILRFRPVWRSTNGFSETSFPRRLLTQRSVQSSTGLPWHWPAWLMRRRAHWRWSRGAGSLGARHSRLTVTAWHQRLTKAGRPHLPMSWGVCSTQFFGCKFGPATS